MTPDLNEFHQNRKQTSPPEARFPDENKEEGDKT